MRIISIAIKGCIRFPLGLFSLLNISFQNRFSLILGTNGSGKSSLMSELSPLPADPKDFKGEGYKIIRIEHRQKLYQLHSEISPKGNKFYFVVDGVELNPSHTVTVYKDLVKQHFGITQEIMDVLTGRKLFSGMTVAERRKWLTDISQTDFSFAMKYFVRLNEEARDRQGSIKRAQVRLLAEQNNQLTPENEESFKNKLAELNGIIEGFIGLRGNIQPNPKNIQNNLQQQTDDLLRCANQHLNTLERLRRQGVTHLNREHLEAEAERLVGLVSATARSLELGYEQIEEINERIKAAELKESAEKDDLGVKLDRLAMEHQAHQASLQLNLAYEDAPVALNTLRGAIGAILQALTDLPANKERRYTRPNLEALRTSLKAVSDHIAKQEGLVKQFMKTIEDQEHLRSHPKTVCPNCEHSWVLGYDALLHKRTQDALDKVNAELVGYREKLKAYQVEEEEFLTYVRAYQEYNKLKHNYPTLSPLFDYLAQKEIVLDNPDEAKAIVNKALVELSTLVQMQDIAAEMQTVAEIHQLVKEAATDSLESLLESRSKLEERISRDHTAHHEYEQQRQNNLSLLRTLDALDNAVREIREQRVPRLHQTQIELDRHVMATQCNEIIHHLDTQRSHLQNILSKQAVQHQVIAKIEADIAEMTEELALLKMAIEELSPKEGLIAKGLTGFINHFISQTNSVIKKIWLYPLQILPVEAKNGELDLDYRFRLLVNETLHVPDVSLGSSAMKEVVDLGFRIVSMQYLGMSDYPIFLDEFGAKMDPAHREAAFHVVTNLISAADFSQIFMISHHENSYGSLMHCDLIVLDKSNIVVPNGLVMNEHVEML